MNWALAEWLEVTCQLPACSMFAESADGGRSLAPRRSSFVGAVRSVRWRNVFGWMRGSLTEEKLLHLLHDDFLILLARRVQAIFVQQHLAVFHPLAPRLLRDVLVDLLSQVAVERRLGKPGQFLFQFCAEDFVI